MSGSDFLSTLRLIEIPAHTFYSSGCITSFFYSLIYTYRRERVPFRILHFCVYLYGIHTLITGT